MIRIEDFKTYKDFKKFITNYLKEENILKKFRYNLKKDNLFYKTTDSYLRYIYANSIKLNTFFYKPFSWSSSNEGTVFWYKIHKKYCQYLEDNFILQQYWDD